MNVQLITDNNTKLTDNRSLQSENMKQFELSWENITVEVGEGSRFWKKSQRKQIILENVSGRAKSGSLVAIMGSSGSGKTTFLGAISGRLRDKKGLVQINNSYFSDEDIKKVSAYVHQQDVFVENLTTWEHLRFVAGIRLSNKNEYKRCLIAEKLLAELGLDGQKVTLIRNLSGGERRRLSLAAELISSPCILFCDEPTTGLDSYSAITVIQKLQTIAHSGKIVLTTIHQPSSQLFQCFNNITLLAEGKLVFQGTKEEAKSFFESLELYCPPAYNPADFYLKCLNHEDVSKMCRVSEMPTNKTKTPCKHWDHFDNVSLKTSPQNNFFYELWWLLWRHSLDSRRNLVAIVASYCILVFEFIFVTQFFLPVSLCGKNAAQDVQGFFAFVGTEVVFMNMYAVMNVFPGQVAIFLREKNLYSARSYFTSKICSLIPLCLLSSIIDVTLFFTVLSFLSGIYLWLKVAYILFLVSLVSAALGLAFSATFTSVEEVDLYMGPYEILLLLMSGLFVRLDTLPKTISWMRYISPFYYSFNSLSNLFWRDLSSVGNCTESETVLLPTNGTEVLERYGFNQNHSPVIYSVIYLHLLILVCCLIGFAGIFRKKILYNI